MRNGIFVVVELTGAHRDIVERAQREFDPKLAKGSPPHVTLAGSSGAGPIPIETTEPALRAALDPVGQATAPFEVTFLPPERYMQTDFVIVPLDPHGPLRALHERIIKCGLPFGRARFAFSPHSTLSFYRTLTPERLRALQRIRLPGPMRVDRFQCYWTYGTEPVRTLLTVELSGATSAPQQPRK